MNDTNCKIISQSISLSQFYTTFHCYISDQSTYTEKFTHQGQCSKRILTAVLAGSVAHVLHLSTIFEAETHIFPHVTSIENSLEVSAIVVYFRNELPCVSWNIFYA